MAASMNEHWLRELSVQTERPPALGFAGQRPAEDDHLTAEAFAQDWYGGYLDQPWRKRSASEARELFARHGLISDFWTI